MWIYKYKGDFYFNKENSKSYFDIYIQITILDNNFI